MNFLLWVGVNACAIAAATLLIDGIVLRGSSAEGRVLTLVLVALIFGVVNAVIRPVVKLLSLPFIILTLGLLIFVINAAMLLLTSAISQELGLGFRVEGFWSAVLGAVIVMVTTWIFELLSPNRR